MTRGTYVGSDIKTDSCYFWLLLWFSCFVNFWCYCSCLRQAAYSTLETWIETVGACTGIESCADKLLEQILNDASPQIQTTKVALFRKGFFFAYCPHNLGLTQTHSLHHKVATWDERIDTHLSIQKRNALWVGMLSCTMCARIPYIFVWIQQRPLFIFCY